MARNGVNQVIILGNIGKDPEVKNLPSGQKVVNLAVATAEVWRDKATNEQRELTEWHRVVCFSQAAEFASNYLRKGDKVYIEGSLQTRKWQDRNGIDRYTTEIVCRNLQGINSNPSDSPGKTTTTPSQPDNSFDDNW